MTAPIFDRQGLSVLPGQFGVFGNQDPCLTFNVPDPAGPALNPSDVLALVQALRAWLRREEIDEDDDEDPSIAQLIYCPSSPAPHPRAPRLLALSSEGRPLVWDEERGWVRLRPSGRGT